MKIDLENLGMFHRKAKINAYIVFGFFFVVPAIAAFVFIPIGKFITKSRESEVKVILSSVSAFMNNYYDEYKEYTDDPFKLGYAPEGSGRTQVFFNEEDLPLKYKQALGQEHVPYVTKDSFRIVAAFKYGSITFWEVSNNQSEVIKLPIEIQAEEL